jgi:hypothetical protein
MKVGDKIEFQVGEETLQDVIVYMDKNVIEGERFDLTYIKFNKINQNNNQDGRTNSTRDKSQRYRRGHL